MRFFSGHVSWSGLAGTIPEFFMAYIYIVTWFIPFGLGDFMVRDLSLLITIEIATLALLFMIYILGSLNGNDAADGAEFARMFFIIVSAGWWLLMTACYLAGYSKTWLLLLIWILFLGKFTAMIGSWGLDRNTFSLTGRLTVMFILYFSMLSFVYCVPLPYLGIDASLASGLPQTIFFSAEPHKAIAFGFLYYFLSGLYEVFLSFRKPDAMFD